MQTVSDGISERLHNGLEQHNLEALLELYDESAELHIIDRDHPPSRPRVLFGKRAIAEHFQDVLSRPLNHQIGNEVLGPERMAFTVACRYPDGIRVFNSVNAEIRSGKIVRETDVQAWDEAPR